MMYQITTPVEITNQKNYQDSLSFSVNINGTDAASKIDHTFVEFRHSKYKNKVYIDSDRTIVKDKIVFKSKLINTSHPGGVYEISLGAYDRMLMKEPYKVKVGKLTNKYGQKNGLDVYAARKSFNPKGELEKEDEEE